MREFDLDEILEEYNNGLLEETLENTPEEDWQDGPAYEEEGYTDEDASFAGNEEAWEDYDDEEPGADYDKEEPYDGEQEADVDGQLTQVFHAVSAEEAADDRPKKKKSSSKASSDTPRKKSGKKKQRKESFGARLGFGTLSLIFMLISVAVLAWTLQNIHPDASAGSEASRPAQSTNLVARLDSGLNNSRANALSDITYIPKHYSIPEGTTVAPKPQEAKFGSVSPSDASAVMDVIQTARDSGLLEGQEVIFSPDLNFRSDTDIEYYCDDTILTILWKEIIDGNTVTCCEVKVADPSQFRRKIVDDTFGSGNQLYATSLAASVNAVVAMNADFYMFRDFGIVVYDHELYRFSEATYTGSYKKYNCTDTLFITESGDFLFWHRLEEATEEEMRAFIAENNIVFSIAFGPILVEDGELQVCDWYPAGEIDRGYSRAGIGQKDSLHYFYMSLNHSEVEARWTVNKFGEKMYERGLRQAYCLDGGQTGEIVWRGSPFNYIDFGAERLVSDIVYFATAIPESEATS